MIPIKNNLLTKLKILWNSPDSTRGRTWEFDGPYYPNSWMSYSREMSDGLDLFNCQSFDDLLILIGKLLKQKPNITDLMGGAYFIENSELAGTITGVRVHDKDQDFLSVFGESNNSKHKEMMKILSAKNRRVVEADLLTESGWRSLKSLPKANLLVCRPVGIFDCRHAKVSRLDDSTLYHEFYEWLFDNLISLTSNKSIIFSEIPDFMEDNQVIKFLKRKDKQNNSKSIIFKVSDEAYHWAGFERRYVVIIRGISLLGS